MKAAIYTRVSTDMQAEKEFNSCETQELKIRSFVASQENMEIYKVFSDPGYTGANTDRPALIEMIHDIQQEKINAVLAYKIDRLTRSPRDFYQLIEVFEKYNVNFISVTEHFDTSTPAGRLLRNIMLTFGQFEREIISERIRDKMQERAKKGLWNSGHTPFGYKRVDKKLIIEPKEAEIIKTIYEVYLSTSSASEVYKKLKADKLFNRKGLPIAVEEISKILKRVVYIGKIEYKGNIYPGIHEPIISDNLFNEAQIFPRHIIKKSKVWNNSLFKGLVQCKECGSTMISVFTNKVKSERRIRYFYYRCSSITKRDRSFCSIRQVSSHRLDDSILKNLDNISNNQQYLESLIYMLNHQHQDSQKGIELQGGASEITLKNFREILQNIVNTNKLKSQKEKEIIIKRHIKKIIYSKESIELKIFYPPSTVSFKSEISKSGADFSFNEDHLSAGCRRRPAAGRQQQLQNNQTADFNFSTVRLEKLVTKTS